MKKIQGAEAEIEIEDDKVVKTRPRKRYRHPELDSRLRDERTETEAHLISEAGHHGVNVPKVEKTGENTIEMEEVEGAPLKEVLNSEPDIMNGLGTNISYLHSTNIIHGDLTTSNVIVRESEVVLIDFGLSFRSQRVEDKAVDLHLLKQVLNTSHPEVADDAWESFLEGYREYDDSEEVLEQLKKVEKRGRYK